MTVVGKYLVCIAILQDDKEFCDKSAVMHLEPWKTFLELLPEDKILESRKDFPSAKPAMVWILRALPFPTPHIAVSKSRFRGFFGVVARPTSSTIILTEPM